MFGAFGVGIITESNCPEPIVCRALVSGYITIVASKKLGGALASITGKGTGTISNGPLYLLQFELASKNPVS